MTLLQIQSEFNDPMYAPVKMKIFTALSKAYDLGRIDGTKSQKSKQSELIEFMFTEVEEDLERKGQKNSFIISIRKTFDDTGALSPAQMEGLKKFYENVK